MKLKLKNVLVSECLFSVDMLIWNGHYGMYENGCILQSTTEVQKALCIILKFIADKSLMVVV